MTAPFSPVAGQVRWLFLDLNAYFASVEQEVRPELRGKPIGIIPMVAKNTCCIAASYEAKAFGVKTGVAVDEARQLCPGIELVESRPELYVEYHHRIVAALGDCLPVTKVVSVDEVACQLIGRERQPENATAIAYKMKRALREKVGSTLRCSIGLAPNRFLAKVGSDLQKPDGLTLILPEHLPAMLYRLAPQELPGIGSRMQRRLEQRGITTMEQLWALSEDQMYAVWGSVVGRRFWRWMRGEDFELEEFQQKSVGHQHVLAPEFRTHELAGAVGQKLLFRAAMRLRTLQMWAGGIAVSAHFGPWNERSCWESHRRILACQDPFTLLEHYRAMWKSCPPDKPMMVGVTLYDLVPESQHTASFFQEEEKRGELARAMDRLNRKYGSDSVYLGACQRVRKAAPLRIPFTTIPEFF